MTIDEFIVSGARGFAAFSGERPKPLFRHMLGRRVSNADDRVAFWGMLNPSSAGADEDDPTIRRVVGFTEAIGCSVALVGNVSDYIATKSKNLIDAGAPVSASWAEWIELAVRRAHVIVLGWGANGRDLQSQVGRFVDLVRQHRRLDVPLSCLRLTTKTHQPEHPLMLPRHLRPQVWQ